MKRIFILLQVMAIHLAIFAQSNYNLKFEENEFSFWETATGYQILPKSVDYYLLGDTTLPALPYKTIYILIPENMDVENVTVNIKTKEILQDIFLIKNPVEQPVSTVGNNSNSNEDNYSKEIYPNENLKFETVIKSRGFYMAAFSVCPFIYNTQKRSLELIIEMNISFNQSRKSSAESTNSSIRRDDMKDFIKNFVINPEEINTLYPQQQTSTTKGTTNDIEYLIITSENLIESFLPLKAWKIKKGIKTEILSTNYIYSNYTGNTNQIKIKKCLQDYYENKNLKWALLGGDNTVVPVQMCYIQNGSTTNTTPCDLFFACFDNAFDWDANGNGIAGEINDNVDMSPEIYISRLPIRNSAHVTSFVNKLLKYETNPATSNYVKKMLLAGTQLWNTWNGQSDAHQRSELMYRENISPFWNGTKYRFYDTGTDFTGDAAYDLTSSNLQAQIGSGYHFFHMATHGATNNWSVETGSGYGSTNASSVQNANASIILTMACFTNGFDQTTDPCLSEAFIRNPNGGCVAYWGGSRQGWGYSSQIVSLGTSFQYDAKFYNMLFNGLPSSDSYKFAAVTSAAKQQFIGSSNSYNSMRWVQFSMNAIGDPEMPIYTEDPLFFSNSTVSQSGTTVTVNTGGVEGCTIALTSIDFGTTHFEVKKNVSSTSFTNINFPHYVTITKHNYIPYQYYQSATAHSYSNTICENATYTDDYFTDLTLPNTYHDTLRSIHGCDSLIVNFTLYHYPAIPITNYSESIYQGETYTDNNFTNLTEDSVYCRTYTNINGCDSVVCLTLTVSTIGIDDFRFTMYDLQVYPNPTSGELTIESGEWRMENVEIYDVMGRLLQSKIVNLKSKITIDISHLSAGIYFLRISAEAGEVVRKVMKE